ncbi:MAG: hypothetical protein IPN18_08000 [Ignavibacteriales bacterium]|nr:hypothetical protein [Ignavibacteriales bacterium]
MDVLKRVEYSFYPIHGNEKFRRKESQNFESILSVNDPSKDKASFGGQVGFLLIYLPTSTNPEQAEVPKEDV